jgi:hypothetical protein
MSRFSGPIYDNSIRDYANKVGNQDILNYPLWRFHIKSSHNSYLGGWSQIASDSDPDATRKALVEHGCRCIELDVSRAGSIKNVVSRAGIFGNDTPVVSHAGADNRVSLLSAHCEMIARHAFVNTDDPLIIFLEIAELRHLNYVRNIVSNIQNHLGSRLYEHKFATSNFNNYFPNAPIKNLIGKVCIVMNFFLTDNDRKDRDNALNNRDELFKTVIHATTDEPGNGWFSKRPLMKGYISTSGLDNGFNKLSRVFPANAIGSANYNTLRWLDRGHSLVSINVQTSSDRAEYNNFFKDGSIVPKNVYRDKQNKLSFADLFNFGFIQDAIWFKNRSFGSAKQHEFMFDVAYSDGCSWFIDNRYELTIQSDGNLVIYDRQKPTWHSETHGNPGAILIIQSDGNLVIYNRNMKAIWSTNTVGKGVTSLIFNNSGKLRMLAGQRFINTIN